MNQSRRILYSVTATIALLALAATALWGQAKTEGKFVVRFSNGDVLHVRPISLQNGKLTFIPDVAAKAPVTVPASRIDTVVCAACSEDSTKTEDTLQLRDGSLLKGTFVSLSARNVLFQVAGLGEVSVPREAADAILRGGAERSPPKEADAEHVVATKAGDILIGTLSPGAEGTMVVQGKDLRATVNYSTVKAVYFPPPATGGKSTEEGKTTAGEGAKAKEDQLRMVVVLRNGTKLFGSAPSLVSGQFSIVIAGNHQVKLPAESVRQLSFMRVGSQARLKQVLVWGRYADRHQEFKRTMETLQGGLAGWSFVEDFSDDFNAEFGKKLMQSRTLVIPEMERWQSPRFRKGAVENPEALAANLQRLAGPFLSAGGNIVILCPSRYQTEFLRKAGLIDVTATKNYDNQEVAFTPEGADIALGIGRSFRTANATQFYKVGAAFPATAWALHGAETPLVGRKSGSGWVILIGMDFFSKNEKTARLLINAVTLK